jgi:hypothetical protein
MAPYHLILSLKSIDEVRAITRVFLWTIFRPTKVAVFPPYRHGNGVPSADGQKFTKAALGNIKSPSDRY